MRRRLNLSLFLLGLMFIYLDCTPKTAVTQKRAASGKKSGELRDGDPNNTSSSTSTKAYSLNERHETVSAFELDDERFLITRFTVGLQNFLNSQTPVLNYDAPLDTDYVEIMRCPANATLTGATSTIHLQDLEISSMSMAEKSNIFRNNDFFQAGIHAGCVQVTQGSIATTFYDSWAPSGSYRYLVRSCIGPDRLTDTEKLTTRNCSLQVAVSTPLYNYVNSRSDTQKQYLQKANEDSAKMMLTLRSAKMQADDYVCFIQWCECGAEPSQQSICQRDEKGVPLECKGGEYGRAVALAKKQALVTLVAVGLDLLMNFGMSGGISSFKEIAAIPGAAAKIVKTGLKDGKGALGGGLMQAFGYGASLSGMSFSHMFLTLATSTEDFPRSCARGIAIDLDMTKVAQAVQGAYAQYKFDECRANAAMAMTSAAAGQGNNADFSSCPATPDYIPSSTPNTSSGQ